MSEEKSPVTAQEQDEALEWGKDILNSPSKFIEYLKTKGKPLADQYGPQFGKYLDKALQYANNPASKVKNKIDKFTNVNAPDKKATDAYHEVANEIKNYYRNIVPKSDNLLKSIYASHVVIRDAYMKIDAIAGQLKPHFINNTIYLNEDSADLMDKLEEQRQVIRGEVTKILDVIEKTQDDLAGQDIPGREYTFKNLK